MGLCHYVKVSLLIFLILNESPSIVVGASLVLGIEKELSRIFNFYNKISQYSVNSALILQPPWKMCVWTYNHTFKVNCKCIFNRLCIILQRIFYMYLKYFSVKTEITIFCTWYDIAKPQVKILIFLINWAINLKVQYLFY